MTAEPVLGVLLAGGLARRLGGGDKCLRELAGRPILGHIIERVQGQVDRLILNANGEASRFDGFGLAVVRDVLEGHPGPLAGILTAMEWAQANAPGVAWIASFPTDAPFLPDDLVERLLDAALAERVPLACARSAGRTHPVIGLWRAGLAGDLRRAMTEDGMRKIDLWTGPHGIAEVTWEATRLDPFFNVNRPEDLAEAERLLEAQTIPPSGP